ncbi:CDP-glycerol glycerophosphotransferase family protein [Thermophagus sp. OGC60D27]|uniref:CDP-glycerol glycerophosphotransferase family protein n=1 Tax=Thermophagus sp. OGC60D27 TaxID=3458415 RepID=UPI0040377811
MKAVLFCYHPYAFGILKPLNDALTEHNHQTIWYIRASIADQFAHREKVEWTSSIKKVQEYAPDAIFVPGNEIPHYLRGVKVQVFHGLAGEKKGHFRIRDYFDLYLTQGPYFTRKFYELAQKHKNFKVVETGWCKLDPLFGQKDLFANFRKNNLEKYNAQKIILYAPTFSPSLTSAPFLLNQWKEILDKNPDYLVFIKFHDLMDQGWKQKYKDQLKPYANAVIVDDPNILKYLVVSDIMVSDTSSVVYEFLLLDKPVITFNSSSKAILWDDFGNKNQLHEKITESLLHDPFQIKRKQIIEAYHPYNDGKSSLRMIQAVESYINNNGIPAKRHLNLYRRLKIRKLFGPSPS